MAGLPIPHHLLEFAQTHVHRISDAIQPSHPLLPISELGGRGYSEILELGVGGWSFSISDLGYPGCWTTVEYPTG